MAKNKVVYFCTECGNETPRWQGKCSACGAWNTIVEHTEKASPVSRGKTASVGVPRSAKPLSQVSGHAESRFFTGLGELDRVLGGGAVYGSLVLIGGAPGIGKSTLLLQICECLCTGRTVLYISGEESEQQIKLRAQRIGTVGCGDNLLVLSETRLSDILDTVEQVKPDILIVDSIQTLYNEDNDSTPGSVSQVKDCTMVLMNLSKMQGITVFVVGHINKDGAIAGPKVLEHMVDCVLYFEGDSNSSYRILRAAKNRFGSTNEIGVFEMVDKGLVEVPNPSKMLLDGKPVGASGTCVACVMEGSRPVLAEIQALVAKSSANFPRRTAEGFDINRTSLLLAVAEKRASMKLSTMDAYINVIGGLRIDEPGADLPVLLSIASSYLDKPIPDQTAAIGEIGLTGEIRSVSHMNQRLSEVARLGFNTCIIPFSSAEKLVIPDNLKIIKVKNIQEAIASVL